MSRLINVIRCLTLIACALVLAIIATSIGGGVFGLLSNPHVIREIEWRDVKASNLRQIGQAALIYASEHRDQLPSAENIADYARLLALDGGLNDATFWYEIGSNPGPGTVLRITAADGSRKLNPDFAPLPFLYRVVIDGLKTTDAPTTPLAWTRGLDLETGEWSIDSLYQGRGGHVLFLNGDVRFYRTLRNLEGGELRDRAGLPTHKIRDALPVGARISEEPPNGRGERLLPVATAHHLREYAIPIAWLLWMLAIWIAIARAFIAGTRPTPYLQKRGTKPVTLCLLSAPAILISLGWLARI